MLDAMSLCCIEDQTSLYTLLDGQHLNYQSPVTTKIFDDDRRPFRSESCSKLTWQQIDYHDGALSIDDRRLLISPSRKFVLRIVNSCLYRQQLTSGCFFCMSDHASLGLETLLMTAIRSMTEILGAISFVFLVFFKSKPGTIVVVAVCAISCIVLLCYTLDSENLYTIYWIGALSTLGTS